MRRCTTSPTLTIATTQQHPPQVEYKPYPTRSSTNGAGDSPFSAVAQDPDHMAARYGSQTQLGTARP